MKVDSRFTKASGIEVFTGNEMLVKGCLEVEGGTHLLTGYPGSPVAGVFDTLRDLQELLNANGIRATIANNEALGVAMVNGSQMYGLRAIAIQKSVGVHVAADALALGNLVGAHPDGGAVVVLGDDPWSDSTQVPADSRYLCKHLMMPILEPSGPQELKDWISLAFRLSSASELYIGYLVTTNQADGGGSVEVRPNQFPLVNTHDRISLDTSNIDFERNVLLPPRTWRKEQQMAARVERLWAAARRLEVNRVLTSSSPEINADSRIGFITSAAAYCYLRHALAELRLDGHFPILKVGITYPVDPEVVARFACALKNVFVIEERRGFLEEQVVDIIGQARQRPSGKWPSVEANVWGKEFPHGLKGIPKTRGLNPSKLIDRLGRLFLAIPELEGRIDQDHVKAEVNLIARLKAVPIKVPPRTPTFCPGCPHRDSAAALLEIKKRFSDEEYMGRVHGTGPVDLVCHGDTGCYTMLMFEPTRDLMHNYSGMGLGGGTGAGIDPFIRNKQVVFMGDSTFFHSGQIAISNSLKNGHDITYIILDNQTTAMTGHQTTPGLDEGLLGEKTFAQNIEAVISGIIDQARSGLTLARLNPAERDSFVELLEKTILSPGVKVVIAGKECGITSHRRVTRLERKTVKELGYLPEKQFINITPEVCECCLECTKATGCPGLSIEETPYGRKVQIDRSWCVADGACTRFMVPFNPGGLLVKSCPSFEEVVVRRSQPAPSLIERLDFSKLRLPSTPRLEGVWHGYLAGVGGMGIGTAAAVLVLAGHKQGYRVQFCDKKGLAIRNGGTYSMISYAPEGAPFFSNVIPYGKADLVLGVDILEAARALDPSTNQRVASKERTAAVINTHKTPTILTLIGKDDFDVDRLEAQIREHTKSEAYCSFDVSTLAEGLFGTQLNANIMLLGVACQKGLIPLALENLEWAIQTGLGAAAAENLKAFTFGRLLAQDPDAVSRIVQPSNECASYEEVVADKVDILTRTRWRGAGLAAAYRQMVERATEHLQVGQGALRDFALRVYDLIQFEGLDYARRYVEWVRQIHSQDRPEQGYAATNAVIWNLHKVMLIKDELYVAHLLTSEEKRRRDEARFNVSAERGDSIEYRHLNRPQFSLLGRQIAWDMRSRDWMLGLFKRMRWLRRVLPEWHQPEREFRDWYVGLLPRFAQMAGDARKYELMLQVLRQPESITGYREIRYPKMIAARDRAETLLQEISRQPAAQRRLVAA